MPANVITDPAYPGSRVFSSGMREHLGLGRKGKLPKEGMPARLIQGILVWVEPAHPPVIVQRWGKDKLQKSSKHRVMAKCPICGETVSAGRLRQHAKLHK